MDKIYSKLSTIVGEDNVKTDEPMCEHITFKVGGPASYYCLPHSVEQVQTLIGYLRKHDIPYLVIGNGSNLIFKDSGYDGVVIDLTGLNSVEVNDTIIEAECGVSLKDIAQIAMENSLAGYEFASGIPGTIGGAIRMNAGAYDGVHEDVVESIKVLDEDGQIIKLDHSDCHFGYRHSVIQERPLVVLSVKLKLEPGDKESIQNRIDELTELRASKQPLEYPSAGSTFRRPEGYFVGKLIQDIGFRGKRVGGAQVSEKHTGFVINRDNATAQDILDLIALIKEEVYKQFGVHLQQEVIVIGD